jgi:hypothetical protein
MELTGDIDMQITRNCAGNEVIDNIGVDQNLAECRAIAVIGTHPNKKR